MRRTPVFLIFTIIIFCALLYTPLCAFSGEGGLYPSAPPPGSAFVRFFNGSNHVPVDVKVRGKSYGMSSFGSISAYAPVPHGEAALSLGAESGSVQLKEGSYYTAMLVRENLVILEEPSNDNKLKAQIILINASHTPAIILKTADGSASVVDAVDPEKLGGRAVNAVKAPFSVYASTHKIESLDARVLERGARYAVIVYDGTDGKPAVTIN